MSPNRSLILVGAALASPTAVAGAQQPTTPTTTGELRVGLTDAPTVRAQMRDHEHDRLLRRYRAAMRRLGDAPSSAAALWSNFELRHATREARAERRRRAAAKAATPSSDVAGAPTGALAAIAQCESGGRPSAVGGGGTFRGLYQFDQGTWQSVGGTGDPAAASPAEQTRRAAILYSRAGSSPWPVCGR